ncbi:putative OmpL-like beta-barrel porin-2 [Chitinophaga dinghuensis]|uniref:Putative OmpL-like beta-barrel porin-2 n=1 Tax=Chitinophaga dinghuensis TaxID=1539050 RepID=A0A327VLQ8_9BACT|nr:outer membrane beta-barrel protein [Chitinophaga dinghuensis]RAJ73749.1 putative OmpL-like beta-barrel porin-2 [Chitinophaga dinghuensis]
MKNGILTVLVLASAMTTGYAQQDSTKHTTVVPDGSNGRSLPSPISSPPFPSGEWVGASLIGIPADAPDYPLTKALGLAKSKSRVKVYGWASIGANFSTSHDSNSPTSYNLVPNNIVLDQVILRAERQPNTVQQDHVDWGFLVDNVFGTDYRYTIAKGIFSDQLLKKNHLYGYDPAQVYGMLYIPKVAQGLMIRVGRFISPADIEAQWAPDNYLYSHSLMFTVDPYTFTGVHAALRLSPYWEVYLGAHGGNDMAPWSSSSSLNGMAMVRWVSHNNRNSIYGGINSLGKGEYKDGHDNLQMVVFTWGHKFSEKVHMNTESYYMWQHDAAVGGTAIEGPGKRWFMGTGLGPTITGVASAVGLVNYLEIQLSPKKDYLSVRNDMLNDPQGNRTGFTTCYSSHTIGWVHHFNSLFRLRPEIRYERAWTNDVTPYDNGTRRDQFTIAMDAIVRF